MANKYTIGQSVVLTMAYEHLTDPFLSTYTPYDPALPTLKVLHPDTVTEDTYTFPVSATIAHYTVGGAVGKYFATLSPGTAGTWRWKWLDPDAASQGVLEGSFTMIAPKIP